ncbi:MAG: DUF2027 domain-containing protein [Bacteroidales bacterium]|nr:DUF2027 domain-containing protein [Bacteroidales bacterium]
MKFKIGDKVKFLNESGGGVVSKIISPSLVNVAISDGFEIPTMTSELLKIELDAPVDSPKHMFREDFDIKIETAPETIYEDDDRNILLTGNASKGLVDPGIYFAFVPQDQKWLITGMLDLYLVNHSAYDILYSVFIEKNEGGFRGKDYGSVNPGSMVLVDSLDREKLGIWEKGVVQVLFHKDDSPKILSPLNSDFKIRMTRFYKETSYKESAIIDGKAVLVSLTSLNALSSISESNGRNIDEANKISVIKAAEIKPENIIDKHRTSPKEAVVDLHIYELVDNEKELEDGEKLKIQVNYFTRCLENAIANNLTKITFIHGVGTGVLKTAIRVIIKDYSHVEWRDASMKQFGYGATDIIIKYG